MSAGHPARTKEQEMTTYFKAEFNDQIHLRSSKTGEYKFAAFYSTEGGVPTFHSRRDLAERQQGMVSVGAVVEIDVTEFRALTKAQKAAEAIAAAARKSEFLAAHPIMAELYNLPSDYPIVVSQWTTTTVAYYTTRMDKGIRWSEEAMADVKKSLELLKAGVA